MLSHTSEPSKQTSLHILCLRIPFAADHTDKCASKSNEPFLPSNSMAISSESDLILVHCFLLSFVLLGLVGWFWIFAMGMEGLHFRTCCKLPFCYRLQLEGLSHQTPVVPHFCVLLYCCGYLSSIWCLLGLVWRSTALVIWTFRVGTWGLLLESQSSGFHENAANMENLQLALGVEEILLWVDCCETGSVE